MFGRGLKAERRFLHIVTSSFDSIAAHVGAGALTPHLKSTQIFLSDRTDGSTGTPGLFPDNGLSFAATGYFVWTKGANGYPWDVKTFDQNFVYDRSTELTWTDPQTFKRFNVDLPMSPRCVAKGAASPVIQIPAANSSYS